LDDASADKVRKVAVPGDLAEADDDLDPGQERDFVGEMRCAGADLFWCGLVARRSAANDGADPHAAQAEAVVDVVGLGLVGEAGVMQDGIKEVARAVAREDPAGAIATVGTGGEAQGQNAGSWVAEAGHGARP